MNNDRLFLRIAAIAALLTVLTTIGVHYVNFSADTLDQRLALSNNNLYIAHRWMIIFHCLLVIISMLGIGVLKYRENKGFIGLGFLFYSVFGIVEMTRMFSVLFYLNGLRSRYMETTDEMTRAFLLQSMDQFSLISTVMFSLFVFAFGLGNLCYGIVLTGSHDKTRWLGMGFLYWSLTNFLGLSNEYLQLSFVENFMEFNGKIFQPIFRLIIGIWLWRLSAK